MVDVAPNDIRDLIATGLEDAPLETYIEDAEDEVARVNDTNTMDDSHFDRLVRYYAAFSVRSVRDRAVASASRESVDISYDGSAVEALKSIVQSLDPSGELIPGDEDGGPAGVTRRSARFGTTRLHGADGIGDSGHRGPEGAEEPRG